MSVKIGRTPRIVCQSFRNLKSAPTTSATFSAISCSAVFVASAVAWMLAGSSAISFEIFSRAEWKPACFPPTRSWNRPSPPTAFSPHGQSCLLHGILHQCLDTGSLLVLLFLLVGGKACRRCGQVCLQVPDGGVFSGDDGLRVAQ